MDTRSILEYLQPCIAIESFLMEPSGFGFWSYLQEVQLLSRL
jgi:hypothetical protein